LIFANIVSQIAAHVSLYFHWSSLKTTLNI